MNRNERRLRTLRRACAGVLAIGLISPIAAQAQLRPASSHPSSAPAPLEAPPLHFELGQMPQLKGRPVENIEIRGNRQVDTAVIRNLVRTRVGDAFDPATVVEDYQRIYGLRKFSNVEAKVEPTPTGVIVVFIVTEQKQINAIKFKGNAHIDQAELQSVIDLRIGEGIDTFRIALARNSIENTYRDRNFPLAHVAIDQDLLTSKGVLQFNITEGPNVRIRKIKFKSADPLSFDDDRLADQIKSAPWLFIFRSGKYDPQQVDEDVASLRKFYEQHGFFDARVGRKLIWSPDLTEMEIDFLIYEGPRYHVDRVTFKGNAGVTDAQLRERLKLTEGRAFDNDALQRDIREMVRAYSSRYGYIYQPNSTDPDYLHIDAKPKFLAKPGHIELVYEIHEGHEFRLGNIFVKGNTKSQERLALREFRDFVPGRRFNSADLQETEQRLRRLPYFSNISITPIGDEPGVRDLLVEVTEQRTASFNIGAGLNSNGGVGGNISYEQRNFDITNVPPDLADLFSDRAFTGAGQVFRASFEPGTLQTNASLRFYDPYVFDSPYGFSDELYLRDIYREHYEDRRLGDTLTLSRRFDYVWSGALTLRAEQVKIHGVDRPLSIRAPEIVANEGKHDLTSAAITLRRDTTNAAIFPASGSVTTARWEAYGALGGDYSFQKFTLGYDVYNTVYEDLLDRKTVLGFHANAGFIPVGSSVFFERFYAGGIGSIRGFRFRGVSPRSGRDDDPVGGDFSLTGSLELNFPVIGESLRGVVFTDAGDVEPDVRFGTIRSSVGAGVRLVLPFLGQTPLAVDFAIPIMKDRRDDTQLISFSFGFVQ